MLNDQLIALKKYKPLLNYLDYTTTPKIGWHCLLSLKTDGEQREFEYDVHIFGANTPQIAINTAFKLLEKNNFGHFIITDTGDIEKMR
jgi:hypothetical protein